MSQSRNVSEHLASIASWFKQWNGAIVGFAGIALSAVTLHTAQVHNKLSVEPKLAFTYYFEGMGQRNGIYVQNVGLGPATVTKLSVTANGTSYDLMSARQTQAMVRDAGYEGECFSKTAPWSGFSVLPSTMEPLIQVTKSALRFECPWSAYKAFAGKTLQFQVEYESLYGEPFKRVQSLHIE